MIFKKNKVKLLQFILLSAGVILIILTYSTFKKSSSEKIIPKETKLEISEKIKKNKDVLGDTFFNVEYSGLDLSGNRYVLKAREASSDISNNELVNLKYVIAIFYLEDDTFIEVSSDFGLYNNKTLDIIFNNNVKSSYEGSELYAQRAEYSNSKNFIVISENVKIKDVKGTIFAEKLVFDINDKKLNISSSKNNKVKANLNYK